jgi:hypothetical protein
VASAAIVAGSASVGPARATPASGFTSSTIARGTFAEIDVFNQLVPNGDGAAKLGRDVWVSMQKTKGASDLYVQSNLWTPGGTSGWHTHPGHSLIIVTGGAVTAYDGDDPSCTPHVYTAGMTLVDPGGDHVHLIRNEGTVDARSITVQLLPQGAVRRIDARENVNCGF